MTGATIALITGALLIAGGWFIVGALVPQPPRLADALNRLAGTAALPPESTFDVHESGAFERLGAATYRRLHLPLSEKQRRILQLRGRSIGDFYAEKLIWALLGLTMPPLLGLIVSMVAGTYGFIPVAAGVGCAIVGFFVPDLLLGRQARSTKTDVREALFTYFDLVVLERLANRSGPQSLAAAAEISNHPIFRRIRSTLDRARLEQTAPYPELKRLATELDLTELTDIADVMRLDESGAALSGVLRARVKELRDAHLTDQRIAAQAVSERLTLPMVVPTLVFTLILFVPPLLRLMSS